MEKKGTGRRRRVVIYDISDVPKWARLAVIVVVIPVLFVVVSVAFRQNRPTGDTEVVVLVDGTPVTRAQMFLASAVELLYGSTLGTEQVPNGRVVSAIDHFLAYTVAKRRGLEATEEEARRALEAQRRACTSARALLCRQVLDSIGMSEEEFWEMALPAYMRAVSISHLMKYLLEANGLGNAPLERQQEFWREFLKAQRTLADFQWRDQVVKRLYNDTVRAYPDLAYLALSPGRPR